jgi:hypothetical protein
MENIIYKVDQTNSATWKEFLIRVNKNLGSVFLSITSNELGVINLNSPVDRILTKNVYKFLDYTYNWCLNLNSRKTSPPPPPSLIQGIEDAKTHILPINIDKYITTFPHDSFSCCIALSDKRNFPWFLKKFMQVTSCINHTHNPANIWLGHIKDLHNDIIDHHHYSYQDLKKTDDILPLIISNINKNHYCTIYLDEFYLKHSRFYKSKHFTHQILIYGYDSKENKLKAIGYNQNFNKIDLDCEIINKSFKSGSAYYKSSGALIAESMSVKFSVLLDCVYEEYTWDDFLINLEEFLNFHEESRDVFPIKETDVPTTKYGIDIYNSIIYSLKNTNKDVLSIDIRAVNLWLEHKKGILLRINYLIENVDIKINLEKEILSLKKIISKINNIRLTYLKHHLINNSGFYEPVSSGDTLNYIIESFESTKNDEYETLISISKKIEQVIRKGKK